MDSCRVVFRGKKLLEPLEAEENYYAKMAIRMSSFVLDLYLWNQNAEAEAYDAFFSSLEMAPQGSPGHKLRFVDLFTLRIKTLVMEGLECKETCMDKLEMRIDLEFRCLTCGDNRDFDMLNRLLDPEPFVSSPVNVYMGWERRCFRLWKNDNVNMRFYWRIIQRLPRVQELLRTKISEATRLAFENSLLSKL